MKHTEQRWKATRNGDFVHWVDEASELFYMTTDPDNDIQDGWYTFQQAEHSKVERCPFQSSSCLINGDFSYRLEAEESGHKKKIILPCYDIEVNTDGIGGGSIISSLKDFCPYCGYFDCENDCAECNKANSVGECIEKYPNRAYYNSAIDGLESFILAAVCAGIDIETPAFLEAIETTVEAISNNV